MPPPPPPPLLLAVLLLVAPAALSLVAAFFTDRNLSGYGASVPASFYFNVSYVPAELGSALADGGNLSCNFASASARGAAWHAVPIPAASYTPSSPFISCVFVDATERQMGLLTISSDTKGAPGTLVFTDTVWIGSPTKESRSCNFAGASALEGQDDQLDLSMPVPTTDNGNFCSKTSAKREATADKA
ncbi:hypothetical protein HDU90_004208 [Geranomyces variabilis]|nr:hypothetical protein HDU90_004208 [Geranomyces variabilis]